MSNIFYGTKCIKAQEMTRLEYCHYRGWAVPAGEDGSDAGYLVEYVDGGAPNHPDHDGYISWSPADVFNRAYQPSGSMNFGHALMAIKDGHKVARSGWNGKGMWIAYTPGSDFPAAAARPGHAAKHRAEEVGMGGVVFLLPHIDMRAADGSMVIGWLASQTDMLAEDWMIVEGSA